ncbi:MAG: diguanylate cyclase, partial [Candidatus Omnitrophica bacterium]|nr:diguanylate cyclase [Candidatus Omnitrophota bacterium]
MTKDNVFKKMSLVPAGLRYKLMIVFCLMSIIPLLTCVYITTNFVFPTSEWAIGSVSLVIAITLFIAILGYIVAKRMIEPIIDMALEAKLIASGEFERSIQTEEEGEVGDLAGSLNVMTERIRNNLTELKSYSEKTRQINAEINKKVMVLSGLLQVGNLISAGTDLKTVLDILVERVSVLGDSSPTSLMLRDEEGSTMSPLSTSNFEGIDAATMPISLQHGIFAKLKAETKDLIIDKNLKDETEDIKKYRELYKIQNSAILPIIVRGKLEGTLILSNDKRDFVFDLDDLDLLHVFCKQAAIAIENDHLMKKTEELEIKDDLTQLYNARYIKDRLDEEIQRAITYQRPCAFIIFNIDNFKEFCKKRGRMTGESALKKIASLIADELTPVDKA